MSNDKENTSVNHQDRGHQEGNQNNTPPVQQGEFQGQRHAENHNQPMSNMLNESEEKEVEERIKIIQVSDKLNIKIMLS